MPHSPQPLPISSTRWPATIEGNSTSSLGEKKTSSLFELPSFGESKGPHGKFILTNTNSEDSETLENLDRNDRRRALTQSVAIAKGLY